MKSPDRNYIYRNRIAAERGENVTREERVLGVFFLRRSSEAKDGQVQIGWKRGVVRFQRNLSRDTCAMQLTV